MNKWFPSDDSQRLLSIFAGIIQLIFSDWILQTKVLARYEGGSQEHTVGTECLQYWVKFFLADKGNPCPLENNKHMSVL